MKAIYLFILYFVLTAFPSVGQTPISLIQPYDKDTIETIYPVFSWHYVEDPTLRFEVKYSFTLVELNEDQSAQAGITVNTPLLHLQDVSGFQFSYPFDAPQLEYNQRYGWQVQRRVNGVVTSESEAWEFILYKDIDVPIKYAVLNTDYSATLYEANKKGFYFKLNTRYNSNGGLRFKVLNDKAEKVSYQLGEDKKLGENEELEKTGRNFFFLKTNLYPTGIYTLVVNDQKGNEYNTRFRIK